MIFSGTEMTMTIPESCSLPFLMMGIMLSFSQSSPGAFCSHGFPHMIDSSFLVTLVTLSVVPLGESHPGMHLSISSFFCISLNCCFCGLLSLSFWNGAGIWLCWQRLRWRLCWCFASCYVWCLFPFLIYQQTQIFHELCFSANILVELFLVILYILLVLDLAGLWSSSLLFHCF